MTPETSKCVMILDERLPLGILANTAAVLGVALGAKVPELVGGTVVDQDGTQHSGIIQIPIPILRGTPELICSLRTQTAQLKDQDVIAVDFSDLAQSCKTYAEFTEKMTAIPEADLQYLGFALCGPKKLINRLTGSLPLLR